MATFLVRALGLTPSADDGNFTDHTASVHRQNINAIRVAGITAGCNPPQNTLYCPNDFVTRAQMATFLVRALGVAPGLRVYRVNSGGPELGGLLSWTADDPASGYVKASNTAVNATTDTVDISDPSIPPGVPEALFQKERWGFGSKMEWDFPVTPGRYTVQLYFAEIFFTTSGQRVMDVTIEDELVVDNFDTVAAAGGPMRAVMKSFTVTSDANLDIDLAGVVDNPALKGIEIVAAPLAGVLGSSPGMLDFGSIATGSNIAHNVVLVNSGVAGDDPITLQGVSLAGTDASQFSFNFATVTLSPGQTTTIPVTFSPNVAGVKSAALQVQHTGSNTPLSVPLAGTGADLTRVNAGGAQVDASPPWIPDDPFVQPGTLGEFPTSDPIDLSHLSVPAGTPEKVFQTQRIGFDPNLT